MVYSKRRVAACCEMEQRESERVREREESERE
jgi:hypothetical protein